MLISFIVISFVLHIISILAIIILYIKYQSLKELEVSIQQTEEALSLFLLEVKDENEKFIKELSSIHENSRFSQEARSNERATNNLIEIKEQKDYEFHKGAQSDEMPDYLRTIIDEQQDVLDVQQERDNEREPTEKDLQKEILLLAKNGYTIEEIAQKLEIGKTEIELFIKFHEN